MDADVTAAEETTDQRDKRADGGSGAETADRDDRLDRLGQLGAFIRAQRRLAELSQRELAKIANLSDAYVSQLERGMHEPTVKVLRSIANALDIRAQEMLRYAGWLEDGTTETPSTPQTELAIRADPRLSETQKQALLTVYRSFLHGDAAS